VRNFERENVSNSLRKDEIRLMASKHLLNANASLSFFITSLQ